MSSSFLCLGSPSLPDKAKHNREVMILLPSHRERTSNMYYNMAENGQVCTVQCINVQNIPDVKCVIIQINVLNVLMSFKIKTFSTYT